MKITKETKIMSLGIGTGIVIPYILKKYADPISQPIPGTTWSWLIPLTTGPLSLILLYIGKIKKQNTKNFLKAYGISTTIAGLLNMIDYYRPGLRRTSLNNNICQPCTTANLPTKAQSAIRYPHLYAPQTDIWSVKPAGFGTMGYPYAQTTFSEKTILA